MTCDLYGGMELEMRRTDTLECKISLREIICLFSGGDGGGIIMQVEMNCGIMSNGANY